MSSTVTSSTERNVTITETITEQNVQKIEKLEKNIDVLNYNLIKISNVTQVMLNQQQEIDLLKKELGEKKTLEEFHNHYKIYKQGCVFKTSVIWINSTRWIKNIFIKNSNKK